MRPSLTLLTLCLACATAGRPAPTAREGLWDIRDTHLFVRDVGPRDAPALVVVHGGPGGNHISQRPLEALSPQYRVILYDQRGTGESDRLDISGPDSDSLKKLTLQENVEDLEALRRKIGQERISLIGHSWGAALAVFYAAAYPERIEKLIVYSGGPETMELAERKKAAHNAKLTEEEKKALGKCMKSLVAAIKGGAPQKELDRLFAEVASVMFPSLYCTRPTESGYEEVGRGGFWANQVAGQYVGSFRYEDIADGLRRLKAPTLLTWGRCEPSPHDRLTNLLGPIPNARFVIFEKSGHNAMEEERDLFFRTIRAFLADKPLPMASYTSLSEIPPGLL